MPRIQEIEARKAEIRALLQGTEDVDLDVLETELRTLEEEKTAIERRKKIAEGIVAGAGDTRKIEKPEEAEERHRQQEQADKQEWRSFGEFLSAVVKAETRAYVDNRLVQTRQLGLNEGVPSEGGFLVQTEHVNELLKRVYDVGVLASRCRKRSISGNANAMTINAINETSRARGARGGGVQAYWLHEAGTKTPSMPSFRQMELKLKKLIGLYYATDELLQDVDFLEQEVNSWFVDEFGFMVDEAIFRGTGVGQPLGITGHPATVAVGAEPGQAANTILYENIVNMWSRMWARSRGNAAWYINQDIEPQLFTMSLAVGVGGVPVYMPAGGASASPFGSLMGRPVIPIEQASTLGTEGDITLADFNQYMIADKGGIQTASSIHVAFLTDQSAFRFVYRCDGQPIWNTALTPANGANTLSPFVQLATR